jgi:hypothetical protein
MLEQDKIQSLNENEYMDYYYKSLSEGRFFRFMQVRADGDSSFIWEHRVMFFNFATNETKFSISATSTVFEDYGKSVRPIMLNKDNFIIKCLEIGITQENINYFFSKEMDMSDDDWENY